jgi:chitinase
MLDFLNLMGYDFTGGWTEVAGHHAQLSCTSGQKHPALRKSCAGGVNYVLSKNFPADKILLGVPVYARCFSSAAGPGHGFSGSTEIDYCDLADDWIEAADIDSGAGAAAYLDKSGGMGFVSFDVPETVRMKADFVKGLGLGGLFYWTGVGDRSGQHSLVGSGHEALNC